MEEEITITKQLKAIRENLKTDKLIIGTERTLKLLRLNKLDKVFLSSNTPKDVEEDLVYYGKLTETKIIKLTIPNFELGTFCKKEFPISVIGLMK